MDEEIPTVFEDLNIEDGPFSMAENAKAKKSVKLEKVVVLMRSLLKLSSHVT